MTTEQTIAVITRMRELLADPDRVVLDPTHYFERADNGDAVEMDWPQARDRRDTCRVCFCGAATMAAYECRASDADTPVGDNGIRELVTAKAQSLGIPLDPDVVKRYRRTPKDDPVVVLTSALKQGRAVEVVDAVLEDLRAQVAA